MARNNNQRGNDIFCSRCGTRIVAALLSGVIAMAMSVSAFATPSIVAPGSANASSASSGPIAQADANSATLIAVSETFQLENAQGLVDPAAKSDHIAGETLYFPIASQSVTPAASYSEPVSDPTLTDLHALEPFQIGYAVTQGASLLETSPSFVSQANASGAPQLFLAVPLRDTFTHSGDTYLSMTISIHATDGCAIRPAQGGTYAANNDWSLALDLAVDYGETEITGNGAVRIPDDAPIVSATSAARQVILCFDNGAEVEGDLAREQDLFLRASTSDPLLEAQYPHAKFFLFDGNHKTFRKEVIVHIPAQLIEGPGGKPQAPYLYDLDQGLQPLQAEYNAEEETFTIRTRTLGRYLVAQNLLDGTAVASVVQP